jgi:hypothetical protein
MPEEPLSSLRKSQSLLKMLHPSSYKIFWTPQSLSTLFTILLIKSNKIYLKNIHKWSESKFSGNSLADIGQERSSARKESSWVFTILQITSLWCLTFGCMARISAHGFRSLKYHKSLKIISNMSQFMQRGPTIKSKTLAVNLIRLFLNFWALKGWNKTYVRVLFYVQTKTCLKRAESY